MILDTAVSKTRFTTAGTRGGSGNGTKRGNAPAIRKFREEREQRILKFIQRAEQGQPLFQDTEN